MTNKFKVGDRAKMTEKTGGYDFSEDAITGYVTVAEIFTPHVYLCTVEGYDDDEPLCFYESELLPIGEEEKKEELPKPKYKVGDVVKMNDKHLYDFEGYDVDGTMTVEEIRYNPSSPLYLCSINGYTDEADKEFLMDKGCLNFKAEWIDGYADKVFKPGDIVKIKGDHEDFTMTLDNLYGIVTKVADDDCEVAVYNPIVEQILYWQVWKRNMTKR